MEGLLYHTLKNLKTEITPLQWEQEIKPTLTTSTCVDKQTESNDRIEANTLVGTEVMIPLKTVCVTDYQVNSNSDQGMEKYSENILGKENNLSFDVQYDEIYQKLNRYPTISQQIYVCTN